VEMRHSPRQADYVLAIVRKVFNWYEARHDDFTSPVAKGMNRRKPKEHERERILSDAEIRKVWNAAEGPYGDLVKLLLLTGQRRDDVAAMRWNDVSSDVWEMPKAKRAKGNGGALTLPAIALDLIARQHRYQCNDYVFPGRGNVPMSGWSKRKRALDEACGV